MQFLLLIFCLFIYSCDNNSTGTGPNVIDCGENYTYDRDYWSDNNYCYFSNELCEVFL